MAENLNAPKPEEFLQQSNFRPLWYWRLILVWAMFSCDKPIKSFNEERQPWGGGIGGFGGSLWASKDRMHRLHWQWGTCILAQNAYQRGGDPQWQVDGCLSWAWLRRQISEIEIYSQNTAWCVLYLGIRAVHFNWLCLLTSSSSYLSSAIVYYFGHEGYHANDAGIHSKSQSFYICDLMFEGNSLSLQAP